MTENEESLPTSARKHLVDWANQQDGWVRRLAGEVLLTRQPVTEAVIDETYEAYLIEKGLAEGNAADQPKIVLDETTSAEVAGFTIDTLEAIEGVNALAAGQSITFNAGLTILFGENGLGRPAMPASSSSSLRCGPPSRSCPTSMTPPRPRT